MTVSFPELVIVTNFPKSFVRYLKYNGKYMYRRLNIKQILLTGRVYLFHVNLRKTATISLYNLNRFIFMVETVCFLWGTNWICIYRHYFRMNFMLERDNCMIVCCYPWCVFNRRDGIPGTEPNTWRTYGGSRLVWRWQWPTWELPSGSMWHTFPAVLT
jgi:hypothetical protein